MGFNSGFKGLSTCSLPIKLLPGHLLPPDKDSNILFTIKPTTCTNFSNLFLEWNSTCFGQFLCPSSGVFHCTDSCEQDQDVSARKLSVNLYDIPLLCVQWKTPDGQRNCPKHVEYHSKNKFEKLVHLVGFIVRNLSRRTVIRTSKTVTYLQKGTACFSRWGVPLGEGKKRPAKR